MGPCALAIAIGLAAAAGLPELVVLPPAPRGVDEQQAIEAWAAAADEFKRAKEALGVSLDLQTEAHDALLGPAKEQAWDCGTDNRCLTELGGTLGADLLITGTISKKTVSLVMLDVALGRKLTGAKSSRKLSKRSATRRAKAAAKGLVKAYTRLRGRSAPSGELTQAKKAGRARRARQSKAVKRRPPKKAATGDTAEAKVDDAPQTTETTKPEGGSGAAPGTAANEPDPVPPPSRMGIDGVIVISADQLREVTSLTVDGGPVTRAADGSVAWVGSPGSHRIVALRADGSRASMEVVVDPRVRVPVTLAFSAPPPLIPATFEEPPKQESVFEKWWFWAGVGAALVAGGVTGAVLVGGEKGGPSVDGDGFGDSLTGSISGTY